MKGRKILVIGGARSGKSRFAQQLGEKIPGRRAFLATCPPLDPEMKERIALHQWERGERGSSWLTVEAFFHLAEEIRKREGEWDLLLIDCLTLWLSNWMMKELKEGEIREKIAGLKKAIQQSAAHVLMVSNEVGMGVVPSSSMGRDFRDLQGFLNQEIAAIADEVYLTVAGIPIRIKPV